MDIVYPRIFFIKGFINMVDNDYYADGKNNWIHNLGYFSLLDTNKTKKRGENEYVC